MSVPPLIVLPLKKPKECDISGPLMRLLEEQCAASGAAVPTEARQHVAQLQQQRNLLVGIEKLTPYTAEDACKSILNYEAAMGRLEGRFDKMGSELQILYKWRDAFHPSKKSEQGDLQWERVGAYFAAAATLSYQAAQAQPRGASQGGLRDAANFFKQAAGCLDAAFTIIKTAIWGLTPRWDPRSLTADVELPMLEALRQLMLAQAQRAFYEKACAEGSSSMVKMQLSAATASLFGDVLSRFQANSHLEAAVSSEAGLFSKGDRSWLGRVECSKKWAEALSEQHAAEVEVAPEKPVPGYGEQVARLWRAVNAAKAAVSVAQNSGVPASEYRVVTEGVARLQALYVAAEKECREVYQEPVPPSMPPVEGKVLVAAKPPEPPVLGADPLRGVLVPEVVRSTVRAHNDTVQALLRDASSRVSSEAEQASRRLAEMQLPHELDAVTNADKHLPTATRQKVEQAKQLGTAGSLMDLRDKCEKEEKLAEEPAMLAQSILDNETAEDKKFVKVQEEEGKLRNPEQRLQTLKSTNDLVTCRSRLSSAKSQLGKAKEVTQGLCVRMDANLDALTSIAKSVPEIEADMPHLDGTALEQEPCVQELRGLIEQLEQVKIDSAATLGASKQAAEHQLRDHALADRVMARADGEAAEAALKEYLQPFEQVSASLAALEQRRGGLLSKVDAEHAKFREAKGASSSYPERVAFFARLNKGADEMLYLHRGLTEGLGFYTKVRETFLAINRDAVRIADERQSERERLVKAASFGAPAVAPVPPPPPPSHSAPPPHPSAPQTAVPMPASHSQPAYAQQYAPQQAQPYQPAHAQPYAARPYAQPQQAYAQPQQPHNPYTQQPYNPYQQQQPARPPQAYAQPAQPARAAPSRMMCYQCKKQFGVPPNTAIAACPFCQTHNRVPGM